MYVCAHTLSVLIMFCPASSCHALLGVMTSCPVHSVCLLGFSRLINMAAGLEHCVFIPVCSGSGQVIVEPDSRPKLICKQVEQGLQNSRKQGWRKYFRTSCLPKFHTHFFCLFILMGARLIRPRTWRGEPTAFHCGCACFHCLKFNFMDITSLSSQIRMQAQGNVIQGSMMGNFINIYQEEGTRGLWKVQKG